MATDFSRLTVLELRQELKRRNLPQTGKKADLVDRLTAFDNEQTARGPDGHDAPDDHHEARDSPPQKDGTQDLLPQDSSATAPTLQPSVAEDVPQASADNRDVGDSSTAAQDLLSGQGLSTENKIDQAAGAEPETATEIIQDTANRKRRSRSPPPTEDESSRKRARPGERDNAQPIDTTDIAGPSSDTKDGRLELPDSQEYGRGSRQEQEHDRRQSRELTPPNFRERQVDIADEPTADSDKDVPPAQHLATPALYIKNFMRPLREPVLRDYLIELAALPRSAPDPDCLVDFYLDQIRTHAFVRFSSVSAASRVRTALHGTVWPDERNRKALWVDFIPDDKVVEWAERERSEGGRASSGRWEVQYEADNDGKITARLVNADMEPVARNSRQPLGPPAVPTGPARSNPAVEGAPLGPRGRGANHYRQQPPLPPPPALSAGGDRSVRTTRAYPPLQYKPVSDELAERRLANMNSFITKDRHRDLGRPDEINRYTFEDGDGFVDRGKEAFIGIRPPHRERERRRLGIGRGNRGLARRPAPSPRSPRDDQGYRGGRNDYDRDRDRDRNDDRRYRQRDDRDFDRRGDRYDDVPRSRFNGQPLPTYSGQRGGGPRFGGGGRRDRY